MPETAVDENRGTQPFVHERLFPYRGSWNLPWVVERYLRAALTSFTPRKLANAILAMSEMRVGVIETRSLPFVLRLEPCNVCNLRCPLCACGNGTDKRAKGFMSLQDFQHILGETRETAMILRLDGMGEPTLHPRIFDMIRTAKGTGLSVVMHSNFNTRCCEDPVEFVESGLDRLVISIDGYTPETHARYRVGGDLDTVLARVRRLVRYRRERNKRHPLIEVQTIDFDYNRSQRSSLRQLCRSLEVDRFQITEAENYTSRAKYDPAKPRRCFWLWTVLCVGWDLEYRSCANAWSLEWPRLNVRDLPPKKWWNHPELLRARQFNLDKASHSIATDTGCKCNRCYEMVVIPLRGRYSCE